MLWESATEHIGTLKSHTHLNLHYGSRNVSFWSSGWPYDFIHDGSCWLWLNHIWSWALYALRWQWHGRTRVACVNKWGRQRSILLLEWHIYCGNKWFWLGGHTSWIENQSTFARLSSDCDLICHHFAARVSSMSNLDFFLDHRRCSSTTCRSNSTV